MKLERIERRPSTVPSLSLILAALLGIVALLWRHTETPEGVVERLMAEFRVPGAVLAYGKDTPTVRAFGNLKADDVLPIASLTKPITAEVVLSLADQGKLSLDDEIGGATIRQLLNHQGGFDRSMTKEEWCEPMGRHDFKPGARASYSNRNYCWLGKAIERATGRPYAEAVPFPVLYPQIAPAAGLGSDVATLWRFFARKPHPAIGPMVALGDRNYRMGRMYNPDGSEGHWGNMTARPVTAIASRAPDGETFVVIFNRRPDNYQRLYREAQDKLTAALN